MASELTVQTLRGPTSGANADTVLIPSGQTLHAPGHVIQYAYNTPVNANFSTTASGSAVDVPNFYVDITPKFSNSIIVFKTSHTAKSGATNRYGRYRVVNANNSNAVFNTNSDIAAMGYQWDGWVDTPIQATNVAGTTSTMRLQLQVTPNGDAGTFDGGWSGSADKVVEAWEIAQ